jgi:hypothetical protein
MGTLNMMIIIGIHDDASLILLSSEVYVGAMVNRGGIDIKIIGIHNKSAVRTT